MYRGGWAKAETIQVLAFSEGDPVPRSKLGVSTDPDKVADVKAWPVPKTVSDVSSYVGFVGFYQRFITDLLNVSKVMMSSRIWGSRFPETMNQENTTKVGARIRSLR